MRLPTQLRSQYPPDDKELMFLIATGALSGGGSPVPPGFGQVLQPDANPVLQPDGSPIYAPQ